MTAGFSTPALGAEHEAARSVDLFEQWQLSFTRYFGMKLQPAHRKLRTVKICIGEERRDVSSTVGGFAHYQFFTQRDQTVLGSAAPVGLAVRPAVDHISKVVLKP